MSRAKLTAVLVASFLRLAFALVVAFRAPFFVVFFLVTGLDFLAGLLATDFFLFTLVLHYSMQVFKQLEKLVLLRRVQFSALRHEA
ncbi:hypothetical protein FBZ93_1288 [Bradyrhizobium macuxiense]|uniref:Uncharacterized protein n=1 Tax=Bradyrhizobium macuxiense TaxID=1755647 RepID=A0A560KU39_9BRAD|nr:hypothetical protein FBZ93_1288 [Bradyrhizobium macuxiense]